MLLFHLIAIVLADGHHGFGHEGTPLIKIFTGAHETYWKTARAAFVSGSYITLLVPRLKSGLLDISALPAHSQHLSIFISPIFSLVFGDVGLCFTFDLLLECCVVGLFEDLRVVDGARQGSSRLQLFIVRCNIHTMRHIKAGYSNFPSVLRLLHTFMLLLFNISMNFGEHIILLADALPQLLIFLKIVFPLELSDGAFFSYLFLPRFRIKLLFSRILHRVHLHVVVHFALFTLVHLALLKCKFAGGDGLRCNRCGRPTHSFLIAAADTLRTDFEATSGIGNRDWRSLLQRCWIDTIVHFLRLI